MGRYKFMVALLIGAVSVFAFSLGKYEKVKTDGGFATIPGSQAV